MADLPDFDAIEERFWEKVHIPFSEWDCWTWQAFRHNNYGRLSVGRRDVGAHRVSWELHNGPIPDGLCVLHRCDNPPCVRPDHLFLGTKGDNTRDMDAKGRARRTTEGAIAWARGRTQCKNGHRYTVETIHWRRDGRRYYRECRVCDREKKRRKYWRVKSRRQ